MDVDTIVSGLESNKTLISDDNIFSFMQSLEELQKVEADITLLRRLFLLFSDEVTHITPFDSLLRYILSQDFETVTRVVMELTPKMISSAKGWLIMSYVFVLTRTEEQPVVLSVYRNITGEAKQAVTDFLRLLEEDWIGIPPQSEGDRQTRQEVNDTISFIFKNSQST